MVTLVWNAALLIVAIRDLAEPFVTLFGLPPAYLIHPGVLRLCGATSVNGVPFYKVCYPVQAVGLNGHCTGGAQ